MPLSSSPLFRKSFLLLHKNKHIPSPQEMKMKNALSATAVSLCYLFSSSSLVQADKPITTGAASRDAHDEVLATTWTNDAKSYFLHKSVIIPHDDKKHRGGEDAAATSDQWLVVADGVGGWASHNVNPGLYSGLLTRHVVELGTKHPSASLEEIIHQANWKAAKKHLGSATCTALKLTGPNQITTLNVGDSGYSIHRKIGDELKLVFASEVGQKRFNFPHQLGGEHGDEVKDVAVEMTHTLEPNDIIVVYSDGVSDNLFPGEFHACLESAMDEENALQSFGLAADCIARKAYFLGKDKEFDSPFAQGARKAGWQNYKGGKHDDITVVVAQISTTPTFEDPYLEESIFLYKGKVGAVEGLPSLASLMKPADGGEL